MDVLLVHFLRGGRSPSLLDRLAGRERRTGRRCLNIGRSELDYLLQERLRPLLCPSGMCLFPPRVDVLLHLDVEQKQTDYQYGHYDRHCDEDDGPYLQYWIIALASNVSEAANAQKSHSKCVNQTYPNYQVCIYDNASGDQTASVVKNLITSGANIRYHRHLTNIGMLENFQYG
jgi:hypothetical protein